MNKIIDNIRYLLFCTVLLGFSVSCEENKDLKSFDPLIPDLKLSEDVINVEKDETTQAVGLKSNLPWRANSQTNWITLKIENGMGDATVEFNVQTNNTTQERKGEILFWISDNAKKTLTITQEPGDEVIVLENHYYVKEVGNDDNDGRSWNTPISLTKALEQMITGDVIHIAEGTYIPSKMLRGGKVEGDKTFEIHSNVTIIGGYPANATEGAMAESEKYPTILHGANTFYHVVTITAPVEEGLKVHLEGVTMKNGKGPKTGTISINGLVFEQRSGAGLHIGASVVDVVKCVISENNSDGQAAGAYIHSGAVVKFIDCDLIGNITGGNGGCLYNHTSTTYLINCNVLDNSTTGVAAGLYSFSTGTPANMYIFNTTVANNKSTIRGGGYYARQTIAYIVNSTFYNNEGTTGGGALSINGDGTEVNLINSTFVKNIGTAGAGIEIYGNKGSINCYNSIISGNIGAEISLGTTQAKLSNIVHGAQILDANGVEVVGKTFDAETMLGQFADNGGRTKTLKLDSASPAATLGMTEAQLIALGLTFTPVIEAEIVSFDQTGKSRSTDTAIGAVIP